MSFAGPVAYIYFYIADRKRAAPSSLNAFLNFLRKNKNQHEREEDCFLRKNCILKPISFFIVIAYPIGMILDLICLHVIYVVQWI